MKMGIRLSMVFLEISWLETPLSEIEKPETCKNAAMTHLCRVRTARMRNIMLICRGLQQTGGARQEWVEMNGPEGKETELHGAVLAVHSSRRGRLASEGGGATREIDLTRGM